MAPAQKDPRRYPISINVYDLMPPSKLSAVLWTTGLSVNHSGVVIDGVEWAFGGHEVEGITGVYPSRPKQVPDDAIFKCTVDVGICLRSLAEIEEILERIKKDFTGPSYSLLNNNCNHFVERVCLELCGARPPAWINRIAGLGAMMPICVSEAWVAPPVANPDGLASDDEWDNDGARLLPPSEVAPMRVSHPTPPARLKPRDEPQGRISTSRTVSEYTDLSEGERLADEDMTAASGGVRVDIGSR